MRTHLVTHAVPADCGLGLGPYVLAVFTELLQRDGDGKREDVKKEGGGKGGDAPPKEVVTEEDLFGKTFALDDIVAAIKARKAQLAAAEADPNLDADTKKSVGKMLKKAIEKLRKAGKDLLDDLAAEIEMLPEANDADKQKKKKWREALKKAREKFEEDTK